MCCTAISVPNLHLKMTACALHYTLVWGKCAILPLPPLVTTLLTSHQSGSCSLDPGWHIHRQSEPGLAGTCILQSHARPGTTFLWADGTAANGREEYEPRCKRMNKEHKEISSETFQWQNVIPSRYLGMKTGALRRTKADILNIEINYLLWQRFTEILQFCYSTCFPQTFSEGQKQNVWNLRQLITYGSLRDCDFWNHKQTNKQTNS